MREERNEPVISFCSFSFGCRVNEAEKQAIEARLIEAGFRADKANPAFCLINTCAVTVKAEREARQQIYRLKRQYPKAKIVITGCAATYWKRGNLHGHLPVDLIIDNQNKQNLPNFLLSSLSYQPEINLRGYNRGVTTSELINSGRILIKIQDGCQRFCTYCIVPYLRGQPKSQRIQDIVKQIHRVGANLDSPVNQPTVNEIILTAINSEAFGYDTGESLVELLKRIILKTAVSRISMGSINPWSINKEFLQFYRQYLPKKRFVNFFHIPLQSGSNKILSLMKRGYTQEEFAEKINALYKINPKALIATDVIVGFLDETDKDFEDTYNFLENSAISRFHVFRYSKRNNTAAYYMAKKLIEPSIAVKNKRSKLLRDLSEKKYNLFLDKLINYTSSALFIDKREGDYQEALLDNQVPAWIKTDKNLNGEIKNVRITDLENGKLLGKIV